MSETQPEPQPLEPTEPGEPTEIAPEEEEAEHAEEGGGGEQPDEPAQAEPETEPPQPEGMSQAEWEDRFKKTDKAYDTYTRAIGRIWEEDATDLIPLTISPSAPPGFLHPQDAGRIPDEVKGPLLSFLGIQQEAEYELDPMKIACDLCKGKGQTKTESLVPNYHVLICRICNGTGLKPEGGTTSNGPPAVTLAPALVGAPEEAQPPKDADDWGTPRLTHDGMPNPNYGRTPQYWDRQFPVGGVS